MISSVMKSRRTEPSCRRWSHFEHRVVSARNSPFMRRMASFLIAALRIAVRRENRIYLREVAKWAQRGVRPSKLPPGPAGNF